MDTSAICESIKSLLEKLESLDEEHLKIPFIINRIEEFNVKSIFVRNISVKHTDLDLSRGKRNDYRLKRDWLLREIVSDQDIIWGGESDSSLSKMVNHGKPFPSEEESSALSRNIANQLMKFANKYFTNQMSNREQSFTNPTINYEDLIWRNPGLITCFVYCSLYPKGHKIIREDLVQQWIAQEFFQPQAWLADADADAELEEIGNQYFNEMLSGGVFQEATYAYGTSPSDDGQAVVYSCVMHPVAYNAARRIAAQLVAVHDGVVGNMSSTKYVAFHNLHDPESKKGINWSGYSSHAKILTTLMLFDSHIPNLEDSISSGYRNMQVLSLTRSLIKKLHLNDRLDRLRYLRLSLDQITESYRHLLYTRDLQTLSIDHSGVNSIGLDYSMFERLRHLYLTTTEPSLELSEMKFLRILELSRCKYLQRLSEGMGNLGFLRALRIFDCPELKSLPQCTEGLPCIEELVLHNCRHLDLTKGNAMRALPRLRYLEMIGLPLLFELPRGLEDAAALEYMMIGNCTRLRRLTDVVQNVVSLKRLCIYKCPNLTALPNGIRTLTQLQSLHIGHCPSLVSRCARDAVDWPIISHIPDVLLHDESTNTQVKQQKPSSSSYSQEKNPHLNQFVPFFALKTQMAPDYAGSSGGFGDEKYDSKDCSRWDIIGLVLKAVFRLRGMVSESRRLQRLYEKEHLKLTKRVQRVNEEEELKKQMKLHCCLFPDDYEIERNTLVQLWMAEGLLKGATMEDVGNSYFGMMVRDKFLLSSTVNVLSRKQMYKINSHKVKAFVDELPILETKGLYKKFDGEIGDGSNKHWHISLVSDDINQTKLFETLKSFNQLRTLLLIRNYGSSLSKVPYEMFVNMRNLHSLDLSGSHIKELPSSIGYVTELRFLDLSFTLVQELPESLGCLLELQALKLVGCKRLIALPISMKRLISLRHLDFDVLGQLSSMPTGIGALTELHTLSAFVVGRKKGADIRELGTLNNLRGSLCISGLEHVTEDDAKKTSLSRKHLTQLQLRWNPNSRRSKSNTNDNDKPDDVINSLRPKGYDLEELLILYFPGGYLPTWMGDAELVKLVSIKLIRCENVELDVALGELPVLKFLHIDQMNLVTEIDDRICGGNARSRAFPKLDELTVDTMLNLTTWTDVQSDDFPVLSKLILRSCPKLIELPFTSLPGSLKHLEVSECEALQCLPIADQLSPPSSLHTLIIDDCPLLRARYSTTGEEWEKIKHAQSIWIDLKNMHSEADTDSNSDSDSDSNSISSSDYNPNANSEEHVTPHLYEFPSKPCVMKFALFIFIFILLGIPYVTHNSKVEVFTPHIGRGVNVNPSAVQVITLKPLPSTENNTE